VEEAGGGKKAGEGEVTGEKGRKGVQKRVVEAQEAVVACVTAAQV